MSIKRTERNSKYAKQNENVKNHRVNKHEKFDALSRENARYKKHRGNFTRAVLDEIDYK